MPLPDGVKVTDLPGSRPKDRELERALDAWFERHDPLLRAVDENIERLDELMLHLADGSVEDIERRRRAIIGRAEEIAAIMEDLDDLPKRVGRAA